MGTLHDVTQLRPFVLSGDGAFLPILAGKEDEFADLFEAQMLKQTGLSRVPAKVQDVDGVLSISGMNTTYREHKVEARGKFLQIEPGGKHGYDSELAELIEAVAPCLGDFWFFVLWGNGYADEYSKSGEVAISLAQELPANDSESYGDYDDFIAGRLREKPVLAHRYLLESGLWAKRSYEADVEEYGREEAQWNVEEFPYAIEKLNKSLEIIPGDPESIAAIAWYQSNLDNRE